MAEKIRCCIEPGRKDALVSTIKTESASRIVGLKIALEKRGRRRKKHTQLQRKL